MKILKERIYPLTHLNCTTDLNCQYCINIPQSPAIQELKSYVFQTLNYVSQYNDEFQDILENDPNNIPHLTHPLIQFASQSQLDKRTDQQEQHNQQKSESSSSFPLFTQSLDLLERLINYKNNIYKFVINTPNALHSLFTLTSYKINIHISQEIDKQTFKVRDSSRWCLWYIQVFGDLSAHSELINARYVGVLVIAISTASGSGEEYDNEIYWRLDNISEFIKCLNNGRNNYEPSFPPQLLLARRSVEQIEEEGGNEEIDSQIINKGIGGNIKDEANEAKGRILNYFVEKSNQRPDWYNW
ncbi:MAG: hypothetical protein EZS28_041141 [Streblomastix strix]|uniref:Uncharacterized protein n=1 Tax=Streblomastix strix TaxID=222440 RepID=A0A5J4TZX0_9EUKA|nr:MAG: hypothetical protein EZS28_041141 [Streblomastix strix]